MKRSLAHTDTRCRHHGLDPRRRRRRARAGNRGVRGTDGPDCPTLPGGSRETMRGHRARWRKAGQVPARPRGRAVRALPGRAGRWWARAAGWRHGPRRAGRTSEPPATPAPAPPAAAGPKPPRGGLEGGPRPRPGMGMNAPSAWGPMAGMRKTCSAEIAKFCREVKPGHGRIAVCLNEHPQELSRPCKASVDQVMDQMGSPMEMHKACADDVRKLCGDVPPGTGRVAFCLGEHSAELSADCKRQVAEMKDGWGKRRFGPRKDVGRGPAPAPTPPAAAPGAPPPPARPGVAPSAPPPPPARAPVPPPPPAPAPRKRRPPHGPRTILSGRGRAVGDHSGHGHGHGHDHDHDHDPIRPVAGLEPGVIR